MNKSITPEMGETKDVAGLAIEPLIVALKDDEPDVRENAANALGNYSKLDDKVLRAKIITALRDVMNSDPCMITRPHYEIGLDKEEYWPVRSAARRSLFNMGEVIHEWEWED